MEKDYPIITLLTDFGTRDAYVSAMKGVMLRMCPTARIVDVSHDVPKYDIKYGALLLLQAAPYFPEGTIHVTVIDPSVGTARRRIIVQGRRSLYVGPDNGVLLLAAEREGVMKAVEVKEERFMLPYVSKTFEGRDVFAPVSAYLASGVKIDEFGPEIHNLVKLSFIEPKIADGKIVGEILHIDSFGNIVTNIQRDLLDNARIVEGIPLKVMVGKHSNVMIFCRAYGEVSAGMPLIIVGSSGFLEVSVNQGSARELFKAKVGDIVEISLPKGRMLNDMM